MVPGLPKANYSVWVRGYGLVDSLKIQTVPGKIVNLSAVPAPERGRGGGILSGYLLVRHAQDSCRQRVPRQRPRRQRHAETSEEPGPMA